MLLGLDRDRQFLKKNPYKSDIFLTSNSSHNGTHSTEQTVNYIEHYGLLRLPTKSGRYERVKEMHSWNSNHVIGRIVLYELTRHSDHHFKSSKKYQVLDCHDESPQMPYGYPTSMVLAMIPPLWFGIMNKRVPQEMIMS